MDHFAQLRDRAKDFEKASVQVLFVFPHEVTGNREWLKGRDTWIKPIGEFFEEKEPLTSRPYLRSLGSGPEETVCPVLADPSLTTSADYGVAMQSFHSACNIATTFIIDREGVVRWKLRDAIDNDRPSADLLLKTIDDLGKK
jgi:alkyl hydroperoxide reductase subunit AhpC